MDIENTEQQQTETQAEDVSMRDELIAAVREAGGTESVDVAAEEQAAAAPATEAAPAAPATAPDPEEKLTAIMRQREAARAKRLEADDYVAQRKREADEQAQRLIEEARAEARRIAAEELAAERAKYRASPTAAIRALAEGGDIQNVIDDVLREGTPEARARAELQAELRKTQEEAKLGGEAKKQLDEFLRSQAEEKKQQQYLQARDAFITTNAPREAAPALHAQFRSPDAVFRALDAQCREWETDGLRRGVDFDDSTLVAYVEKQSREWLRENGFTLATPAQQSGAVAPAKEPGLAPKSAANGTRTLSAAMGSERRTSPKPLAEMKPDERRAALIEEVAAARRVNPDATF